MAKSDLENALRSLVQQHGFEAVSEFLQEIGHSDPDIGKSKADEKPQNNSTQDIVDAIKKYGMSNAPVPPQGPVTQTPYASPDGPLPPIDQDSLHPPKRGFEVPFSPPVKPPVD